MDNITDKFYFEYNNTDFDIIRKTFNDEFNSHLRTLHM